MKPFWNVRQTGSWRIVLKAKNILEEEYKYNKCLSVRDTWLEQPTRSIANEDLIWPMDEYTRGSLLQQ